MRWKGGCPARAAAAFRVLRRYAGRGWGLYLVGGPVRDALLGRPVRDLDFTVAGDALVLAAELQGELGGQWRTHPRFGTASGCIGGQRIDLAGARRERYARPGALPQVAPGTLQDDLARRDFSINAMALPLAGVRPRVVDYGGGPADLAAGVIRTLHPGSFRDDPTRMLRGRPLRTAAGVPAGRRHRRPTATGAIRRRGRPRHRRALAQ